MKDLLYFKVNIPTAVEEIMLSLEIDLVVRNNETNKYSYFYHAYVNEINYKIDLTLEELLEELPPYYEERLEDDFKNTYTTSDFILVLDQIKNKYKNIDIAIIHL